MESDNNLMEKNTVEVPLIASLLLLLLTIATAGLIGIGLIHLLGMAFDLDLTELIAGFSDNSTSTERNFFRLTILINHLTMFVIPGIVFCLFLYGKEWLSFLRLDQRPTFVNMLGGVFLLFLSFPFVQFLFWFNQNKIPLPDWARSLEASTADTLSGLMVADSSFELLFNVLIIAFIPAIGEELIFRGIIQKKLSGSFRSPIVGIWLAALIFSTFHMQFEGFLPRLMLGALLGYLYYWTNNLWIPIIAHFMNNFIQVVVQYLFAQEISALDLEQMEVVSFWQWGPSLVLVLFMGYSLQQYNRKNQKNLHPTS